MKKFAMQALGAAGVTYAATNMVYGGAEYADVGFTLISADLIQKILPIIVGIVFPLLPARWSGIFKWVLRLFKTDTDLLDLINRLEVEAAKSGCESSLNACQTLRKTALKRLQK